jgi:hypothetical protein
VEHTQSHRAKRRKIKRCENYSEWELPDIKMCKGNYYYYYYFNGLASVVGRENEVLYFALECPPNNSDNLLVDTGFHLLARSFFEV